MNFTQILRYINELPVHLNQISQSTGIFVYFIVAMILMLETGGVVLNFLPGDTLVFACAALSSSTDLMDIRIIIPLSLISSFTGDFLNFSIGQSMGKLYLKKGKMRLINPTQFEAARKFIQERGRKGFIINRFIPLARVYVVFLTGFLQTEYRRIFPFHLTGVIFWNAFYLILGYFFGNIPFVRSHFSLVIIGVFALSVIPAAVIFIKNFRKIKESELYKAFFSKDKVSETNRPKDTEENLSQGDNEGDSLPDRDLFEEDIFSEE